MEQTVEIRTAHIKLDALLKFAAVCSSGGEAKLRIEDGQVAVNGEVCRMRGKKIYSGDVVMVGAHQLTVKTCL